MKMKNPLSKASREQRALRRAQDALDAEEKAQAALDKMDDPEHLEALGNQLMGEVEEESYKELARRYKEVISFLAGDWDNMVQDLDKGIDPVLDEHLVIVSTHHLPEEEEPFSRPMLVPYKKVPRDLEDSLREYLLFDVDEKKKMLEYLKIDPFQKVRVAGEKFIKAALNLGGLKVIKFGDIPYVKKYRNN